MGLDELRSKGEYWGENLGAVMSSDPAEDTDFISSSEEIVRDQTKGWYSAIKNYDWASNSCVSTTYLRNSR